MPGWIIEYMRKNKYQVNEDGVCFGIASMAKQAILLGEFDKFIERIKLMGNSFRNQLEQELTEEEKVDILAFLDGVQLYQSSYNHLELFGSKVIKSQYVLSKEVFDIVRPLNFQKKSPSDGVYNHDWFTYSFSGCYTIDELTKYLQVLEETISDCFQSCNEISDNICFELSSNNHTIILNYDTENKLWHIINANDLSVDMNSFMLFHFKLPNNVLKFHGREKWRSFVAKDLYRCLNVGCNRDDLTGNVETNKLKKAAIYTQMFVSNKSTVSLNNMDKFIDKLNNNDTWKQLNTITKDKILPVEVGVSWLFIAALCNDFVKSYLLIKAGANVHQVDNKGMSLLRVASQHGHTAIAQLLIKAGANVHQVDNRGVSPLLVAVKSSHTEIVKLLIKAGANVNQIDNTSRRSLLWIAAEYGNTEIANLLIQARANIEHTNEEEIAPLWIAAYKGHSETVKLLIEAKANINQVNNENISPLWIATQNGSAEIVKMLIEAKANVDQSDNAGISPIWVAAEHGNTEILKMLIEAKANVDQSDNAEISPIWVAAEHGHTEIVKMLIEAKANIDQSDNAKISPIWIAAQNGHAEIVKLLLENNAAFNMANNYGQTPLMIAKQNGHTAIVHLLENYVNNKKAKPAFLLRSIVSNQQDIATPDIQVDDAKNQRIHLSKTF